MLTYFSTNISITFFGQIFEKSAIYAQMQFERYKTATQPYYVILDPKTESTLADTGGYIPNGFDRFLSNGVKKYYSKNQ